MIEMTTREFLVLQLVLDGILALLVLFLLWQVRRALAGRAVPPSAKDMEALRRLVEDSRAATDHFLTAVQESRAALREQVQALDERERRVRDLLARVPAVPAESGPEAKEPLPGDPRTGQVLALAEEGLSEREIAGRTGVPDGEVRLILNLAGQR